jgi:hypothetical protein
MEKLLEEMLGERWRLIAVLVLLSFGLVVAMAASHL